MKTIVHYMFFLWILVLPAVGTAAINAGVGKTDITPPIGTPSAGYAERRGAGMEGVHDPLQAIALFIDNGEKKIVLCSVDHLGFTYEMVQEITQKVHNWPELATCDIYIASSHTHSGGGAYLNIPVLGETLAGTYSPEITQFYIEKTVHAILQAYQNRTPAKLGIGYGKADYISVFRSSWPEHSIPLSDIAVIKVTGLDNTPLAVLFNYPVHPTVLKGQNRLFSADFVGYARDYIQRYVGSHVQPIYFNGAQGDINPAILNEEDRFDACSRLADSLAKSVKLIWDITPTDNNLQIATQKTPYSFKPQATPFGLLSPVAIYNSEINLILLNRVHAFITIPGELSSLYDTRLKSVGEKLGFAHVSIFGLTNDAHGYIILPEAWRHKTPESGLSFGGENYGDETEKRAITLLEKASPRKI